MRARLGWDEDEDEDDEEEIWGRYSYNFRIVAGLDWQIEAARFEGNPSQIEARTSQDFRNQPISRERRKTLALRRWAGRR